MGSKQKERAAAEFSRKKLRTNCLSLSLVEDVYFRSTHTLQQNTLTSRLSRCSPDDPLLDLSAFGRACGVLLDTIVRWLALSRINPNVLTFMGLVVNTWAAVLFGSANASNQRRMFFYAGLVIIFSGFFDLVDGQVARATNRVTRFGAFFRSSVVDRYSDASAIPRTPRLLRPRRTLHFWVVLSRLRHGQLHHGELHPRPRRDP